MSEKDDREKGFKVTDRRIFGDDAPDVDVDVKEESGTPEEERQSIADEPPTQPPPPPGPPPETEQKPETGPPGQPQGKVSEMDFTQLVMSFASTALIQMGEAPQPEGGTSMVDMEAARQTINILTILKEKTKGNLEPKEQELMDSVVAELQVRFVQKTG